MKMMKRILVLCLVVAMCMGTMVLPARAVFGSAEAGAYVDQLYKGLLNRDADDGGRVTYVNMLVNNGVSAAHVAELIVGSAEFRARPLTHEEYVQAMYKGILGRDGSAEEVNGYLTALNVGKSRTWVFQQFIASPEFKTLCENTYNMFVGSYSTGDNTPNVAPTSVTDSMAVDYVKRLYTHLLARDADTTGLDYWTAQLTLKKMSAAQVAAGIAAGNEFNSKAWTDSEFVQRAYLALLNRPYDDQGFLSFMNALQSGKSRAWVFAAICASSEFQDKYGAYTKFAEMNVTPGTAPSNVSPNNLINGGAVNSGTAAEYVCSLYLIFLDRSVAADNEEVQSWVRLLTSRQLSAAGVAAGIAGSDQARGIALTRDQWLTRAYEGLLGREPDAVGRGTYVNALASGYSRSWVFAKICQSTEFQNRAYFKNMNVVAGYINSASYDMG